MRAIRLHPLVLLVGLAALAQLALPLRPAGAGGPPEIDLELSAGEARTTLFSILNRCSSTHTFRLQKKRLPLLSLAPEAATLEIPGGQKREVELRFDAAGHRPGTYRGRLRFECIDCRRGERCRARARKYRVRVRVAKPTDLSRLARRLGKALRRVQQRFRAERGAAHTLDEVRALIRRTQRDLEAAFETVDAAGELGALRDWVGYETQQIDDELGSSSGDAPPGDETARRLGPRPVAVLASLAGHSIPGGTAAARREGGEAQSLLDRLGEILATLIRLAESNDLTVDLTVSSRPEKGAWFRLFRLREDEPSYQRPTDGVLENVRRGLYRYRVVRRGYEPFEARLDLMSSNAPLCCVLDQGACYPLGSGEACEHR